MPIVALAPFVVYGLVRTGAWLANRWSGTVLLDGANAHLLGLALAAAATVRLATDVWGARGTTESWRKGAEGEQMTARHLDALPDGYVVLHDVAMPRSAANIDHLVIGPTGVFTIETKHYSSEVVIRRGAAWRAGRSMARVVEQAQRQAAVARAALGHDVRAVVCVQGAGVAVSGMFARPVVDGVRFCSGRRMVKALVRLDRSLAAEDVRRLSGLAVQQFPAR